MGDFIYTTVPGKIKPFLEKVRQVGVPPKATVQWLKSVGFTSSNDSSLIGVLKVVDLVDGSNVPTATWSKFRGAHYKKTLGEAIQTGYAELFAVYPDAWQRSNTDLEHVFSTNSTGGKQVIAKTVATFKALCDYAEFSPVEERTALSMHTGPMHAPVLSQPIVQSSSVVPSGLNPSVHIDIQIHISPEASVDQIDQIFKSMAKHLYGAREVQ